MTVTGWDFVTGVGTALSAKRLLTTVFGLLAMSGVDRITYHPFIEKSNPVATVSQVALFDLFRGLSIMNSKNYEYTDRSGNLQGVLCDITLSCSAVVSASLWTAPNSWKLRNAVRRFHFERNDMFENAGITRSEMGKYGKTIRPYFDLCHANDEGETTNFTYYESNPIVARELCPGAGGENPEMIPVQATGGEWTRTVLTSADPTPLVTGAPGQELDLDDMWTIHLLGGHDTSGPPWASVGMVLAYNEDRMEVVTPDADETVTANNPLALLTSQTVTGGAVAEIAEDQELEATPYDISDDGDSIRKVPVGELRCVPYSDTVSGKAYAQQVTIRNVFLPAGYLAMSFSEALNGSFTEDADYCAVHFDVHGIVDCKDWIEA